jgi:phosphotriesterase-related protein
MIAETYRVRTTAGIIDIPLDGGVVLPHEHIVSDSRVWWEGSGDWREFDDPASIAATPPEALHSHPQSTLRENLLLSDWYVAAKELRMARDSGTQLVVDLTVLGSGPNAQMSVQAARLAGVEVVVSAGRYLEDALPDSEQDVKEDDLVDRWMTQILEGYAGLLPGIIGEIGTSWDITDAERTSLRAAGRVQALTGLALNIHVHPFAKRALEAISIAERAGANPGRIAISHLDCEIDAPQLENIMRTGAYVEMDNFGTSRARFVNGSNYPDDSERLDAIEGFLEGGFGEQLLLSHDINHRNSLVANGGWGYRHIAHTVLGQLVERFGTSVARQLTAANPLSLLHIAPEHEAVLQAQASRS